MAKKAQTKLQKKISKINEPNDIPPVLENEYNNSSGIEMDFSPVPYKKNNSLKSRGIR